MREGAEGLELPRGADVASGEGPVPWGAASEHAVLEEVVRRLSKYGAATVRLDGYTPFPLDYAAFRTEMERVARALPAPSRVEGEAFTYVFSGEAQDFADPEREGRNRQLRASFLDDLRELLGSLPVSDLDLHVEAPRAAASGAGDPPPGARVAARAGVRALTFVLGERSVEEVAWEQGPGSTMLTVGVALDGDRTEGFLERTRDFFARSP